MEVAAPSTADPTAIGLYATWGKRLGAWLLDSVLLWVASALLERTVLTGPGGLILILLWPAYFTLCHGGEHGQTLGKRACGIAVRDAMSFGRLGYPRALGRWLVTALFWSLLAVPGLLDGLSPLWRPDRRAWHDRAAGSLVIQL
jgi:uncharacterized RDD family membrane protein YckC